MEYPLALVARAAAALDKMALCLHQHVFGQYNRGYWIKK